MKRKNIYFEMAKTKNPQKQLEGCQKVFEPHVGGLVDVVDDGETQSLEIKNR